MAEVQFGAQVSAYLTSWDDIKAVAQTMDAGRYDSIWFADHFVPPNRGKEVEGREAFEAFSLAAAVAVATETLRCGHLVLGNTYRNPGLVAKISGSVDHISHGRFTLGIGASSEFDGRLRVQVGRSVGGWRYGAARDDEGNAVASRLSWRMKFQSPEEERNAPTRRRFDPQLDVLVSAGALPSPMPQATLAERVRILNRTIEVAEKYIDREHRRRRETERFILISDADDESTVDILAGNMEAVFGILHEQFDPHIEPLPARLKVVVYLFRSRNSLRRLQEELGGRLPGAGFYHSPGLLAFHQEVRYFDELLHTMLHEAFHAFSDTYLTGPGSDLPRWAEEGMAEYYGNSKIERGTLIPGAVDRGRYAISHARRGPVRLQSLTTWNLEEARSALRKGEAPGIAELMEASADTFYGERAQHYYGFSWLLTHFLQHGREDWESAQSFARMLLYLAEGYPSRDALEAVFQTTPAEIQAEFERYVRGL